VARSLSRIQIFCENPNEFEFFDGRKLPRRGSTSAKVISLSHHSGFHASVYGYEVSSYNTVFVKLFYYARSRERDDGVSGGDLLLEKPTISARNIERPSRTTKPLQRKYSEVSAF
jgi:hypothetical protein